MSHDRTISAFRTLAQTLADSALRHADRNAPEYALAVRKALAEARTELRLVVEFVPEFRATAELVERAANGDETAEIVARFHDRADEPVLQ